MNQIATVEYQITTYTGEIKVYCNEHDTNDEIETMARHELIKTIPGGLPQGYQSFTVISREDG